MFICTDGFFRLLQFPLDYNKNHVNIKCNDNNDINDNIDSNNFNNNTDNHNTKLWG